MFQEELESLMNKFRVAKGGVASMAEGGMMDMGGMEMDLRGGGFVPMGRAEKADDVPARLSKNEFVFTADAVRAAGGGDVDKGADKMYATMKKLENRGSIMAITRAITQAPAFIQDLAKDYGTQLAGLTAVPLDTSRFAPQVAAQDPLQTQAVSLAGQGVGSYQPFLQQAQTTLAGAQGMLGSGAGTGAGTISDFMSPYQSSVIDTTLAEFDRNRAIQEQTLRDQQAKLGVLGAGRAGVQLAEYGAGADRERAALQAQLLQQGFGQAQASKTTRFCKQIWYL